MRAASSSLGKIASRVSNPSVLTRPMVVPAIAQSLSDFEPLVRTHKRLGFTPLTTHARVASQPAPVCDHFAVENPSATPLKIIVLMSEDAKGCITANLLARAAEMQGHSVALMIAPTDRPATTKRKRNFNTRLGRFEMEFFNKYFVPWVERLPAFRRGANKMKTFDELSSDFEIIKLRHGESINDPVMLSALSAAAPDVMVSARFQQIFKEDVLSIPSKGIWNIHPGEVHRFKGLHPDLQAMRVGESHAGIVLHQVDTGIDTGLIHSSMHVDLGNHSSLLGVRTTTAAVNAALICRLIGEFAGTSPATTLSQHPVETCDEEDKYGYYSWPSLEQFSQFEESNCFVDNQSLMEMMSLFSDEVLPLEFVEAFRAGEPKDDVTAATMFQFNKC